MLKLAVFSEDADEASSPKINFNSTKKTKTNRTETLNSRLRTQSGTIPGPAGIVRSATTLRMRVWMRHLKLWIQHAMYVDRNVEVYDSGPG